MFLRKVDKSFPDEILLKYITSASDDEETITIRMKNIRNIEMRLFLLKYWHFLLFSGMYVFYFLYFLYRYI